MVGDEAQRIHASFLFPDYLLTFCCVNWKYCLLLEAFFGWGGICVLKSGVHRGHLHGASDQRGGAVAYMIGNGGSYYIVLVT